MHLMGAIAFFFLTTTRKNLNTWIIMMHFPIPENYDKATLSALTRPPSWSLTRIAIHHETRNPHKKRMSTKKTSRSPNRRLQFGRSSLKAKRFADAILITRVDSSWNLLREDQVDLETQRTLKMGSVSDRRQCRRRSAVILRRSNGLSITDCEGVHRAAGGAVNTIHDDDHETEWIIDLCNEECNWQMWEWCLRASE